jgi:hypothetical protein
VNLRSKRISQEFKRGKAGRKDLIESYPKNIPMYCFFARWSIVLRHPLFVINSLPKHSSAHDDISANRLNFQYNRTIEESLRSDVVEGKEEGNGKEATNRAVIFICSTNIPLRLSEEFRKQEMKTKIPIRSD